MIAKLCTLVPCPLCGREVRLTEWRAGTPYNDGRCVDYSGKIECDCGLTFEHEWTSIKTQEGVVIRDKTIFDAWNERPEAVIRCRECRFCSVNPILRTFRCSRFMAVVRPNDFCIYGKRRAKK